MQRANWRQPYVQHTFVVTVDDDDYWKGDFAGREPVRRDLLARIITKLADAQARVIAVDFDLRSPMPDGTLREIPAYQQETDELLAAVAHACSGHHAVVLPATIASGAANSMVSQSDIYLGLGLSSPFFSTGYIALPYDARLVPLEIKLEGIKSLDSFALAAVRAYRPAAVRRIKNLNIFPFGGYLEPGEFPQLSASAVLSLDQASLQDQVGGKLVIIGANWHRLAWKTGSLNDVHATPAGPMSGVFVHANYAEAILSGSSFSPAPDVFVYAVETLALLAMVVVLAVEMSFWRKMGIVAAVTLVFAVASYLLAQNLGVYFDFLIPLAFLLAHFCVDNIMEWRRLAGLYEQEHKIAREEGRA
jgi:CHASE2 domain-containing sensor protein